MVRERKIDFDTDFDKLAHAIVGLPDAGWLETQERADAAAPDLKAVWRQNSLFFFGGHSFSREAFNWLGEAQPHYGGYWRHWKSK